MFGLLELNKSVFHRYCHVSSMSMIYANDALATREVDCVNTVTLSLSRQLEEDIWHLHLHLSGLLSNPVIHVAQAPCTDSISEVYHARWLWLRHDIGMVPRRFEYRHT